MPGVPHAVSMHFLPAGQSALVLQLQAARCEESLNTSTLE